MREKYVTLDGIRGLAALFVLARHTSDYWGFELFRNYLAVDIFFLLSGFVIAHSYEAKLAAGKLSAGRFVVLRLVRLYPMLLIALVVAVGSQWNNLPSQPWRGFLLIPEFTPPRLFPLDVVVWSLFCEIVLNIVYAYARPLLTDRVLAGLVLLAFALMALLTWRTGDLSFGWQPHRESFVGGFARAAFGIGLGILMYRHRTALDFLAPEVGGWWVAWSVCTALIFPSVGSVHANGLVDLAIVGLFFPLCLIAAVRHGPTRGAGTMLMLGTASYPLYLLHMPLADVGRDLFGLVDRFAPFGGIVFVACALALSLAIELLLDRPIRRYLLRSMPTAAKAPATSPVG